MKAYEIISKGCLYHIVRVKNLESKNPPIDLVPVLREFPYVFPNDLPVIPPEWKVNFVINFLPDTNAIYIPPYLMDSTRFKEMKYQLKDLLDKGFIRPSISPSGAPVLFV